MSDVAAIEAETATKREVAAVRTETASIAGLAERRIEFAGMMFALERRFDRLEAKIEVGFAEVRNEIARSRNAQSVLLLPLLLVQTVTLLYLLVRPLLGTTP